MNHTHKILIHVKRKSKCW